MIFQYYTLRVEHSYQGARLLVYQKVYDFIQNGSWCFSSRISNFHFGLINDIKRVVIPINTFKDELVLGNSIFGDLSFKEAYFTRSNVPQPTNQGKTIWSSVVPPFKSLVSWKLIQNSLPTYNYIRKRGFIIVSCCSMCNHAFDDLNHLFLYVD